MQTEVMRYYGLARPPVDLGFFETEHHAQLTHDLKTAITGGRLIALTATIGSGKTVLTRRLREELEREGRVIVSRALSLEKAKISVPLLVAALFYDLSSEKTVSIPSQSERRERDLQELFRKAKRPVALFVDDAHDLHPKTLTALKRLESESGLEVYETTRDQVRRAFEANGILLLNSDQGIGVMHVQAKAVPKG